MEAKANQPLSRFTTLAVGGPADALIEVRSVEEMREAIAFAQERGLEWMVLGKGSNVLFSDQGYGGLVILNRIDFLEDTGELWRAGGGFSFSLLGNRTARAGQTGLELAAGIPGSVGGAVVMNAGANGQETADVLVSVEVIAPTGESRRYLREQIEFAYRSSPFQSSGEAVVAATFQLQIDPAARQRQLALVSHRKKSQPLWEKSAGCIFRNPEGHSAGRLIETAGCKGLRVGGAQVSDLHANFIINHGEATAEQIRELIQRVQERVKQASGLELETEVRTIGRGHDL